MALTSSSTATQALAQYNDNLRWWESRTKAGNLLEAIVWLLGNRAAASSESGGSLSWGSLEELRRKLENLLGTGTDLDNQRTSFVKGRPL